MRTPAALRVAYTIPLGALVALLALFSSVGSQSPSEPADLLPVKYVAVPADGLERELGRLRAGALVRESKAVFAERLSRARAALAPPAPQLAEARYSAHLAGSALVGGGRWLLIHSGSAAGVFPLQPFNLALNRPRFDDDANKADALVAEFDGAAPGLLVERAGRHTVAFDWSRRGEARADGLLFHLEMPPCAVSSLEVELPEDRVVVAGNATVSGPRPAATPDRQLWRIALSRQSSVELRVTQAARDEPPTLLVRRQRTALTVTPDVVEAEFAVELDVPRGRTTTLNLACDPGLRPYEVFAHHLSGWELKPAAGQGAAATLALTFAAPVVSGTVTVRCVGPPGGGGRPWTTPWLRVAGAVPGEERLTLTVHPDVALEGWDAGGFRLESAAAGADGQVLKLVGGLLASGGRPSARLRAPGADVRVRQQAWWRLGGDRPLLTTALSYEVGRGRVFGLSATLPPDYDVAEVRLQPADLLRGWDVREANGRRELVVDLKRPLAPPTAGDRPPRLTVELRGRTTEGRTWPFPDVVPLGVGTREGGLAVDVDELRFVGVPDEPPPTPGPPRDEGPWGSQSPEFYYPYRGRPPRGGVTLRPLPARLRARVGANVVLAAGRAAVETTLTVQADIGSTAALDLYIAAPVVGRWDWQVVGGGNAVTAFERRREFEAAGHLRALAAREPLGAAALLLAEPRGEWRRLTLARPVAPREPVTLRVVADVPRDSDRWPVPLVALPAAARCDGEAALYLSGARLVQAEALGLREAQAVGTRGRAAPPWRTYRYNAPPLSLTLRGADGAAEPDAAEAVERAELTSVLRADGRLVHHFRCDVVGWRRPELALRLPAGARLLAAQVDGAWLDRRATAGDDEVRLPVPATGAVHRFDLIYSGKTSSGFLVRRLTAPAPGLPVEPTDLRRRWRLPPGLLPLDATWRPVPGSGDVPPRDDHGRRARGPHPLASLIRAPLAFNESDELQRRQLAEAARAEGSPGRPLGEVLEALVCDHPVAAATLVVEAAALDDLGLTPRTPLPADRDNGPFWERLGLVLVPGRSGPLLTARGRGGDWRGDHGPEPPADVEDAVADAVAHGHDASGRFRRALDWARDRGPTLAAPGLAVPFADDGRGGSAWEPTATADGATLVVVRPDAAAAAGMALSALLLAAFWALRGRAARGRLAFVLVWLAAAGFGVLWLPSPVEDLAWWPFLAGVGVALAWHLWAARTTAPAPPAGSSARRAAAVAGLLAVAAVLGRSGHGAPAGPTTVLVLVDPADDPDVLVPAAFHEQVAALAKRGPGATRGAALVAAEYTGRVEGDSATFDADLVVHAFEPKTTLSLPFVGVRLLDDGVLDSVRAFVVPAERGKIGYVLNLEKPGAHRLRLRFGVAVGGQGGARDLTLTVPRSVQSRVAALTLPAGATGFRAFVGQGEDAVAGGAARVEVGRVTAPLHFRWREGAAAPPTPSQVREIYLWDLRPGGAALTALLHYDATLGGLATLEAALPDGLEPRGAEVKTTPGGTPLAVASAGVVAAGGDGRRRYRLVLQTPAPGSVLFRLDLVPRTPPSDPATFPLPEPLGVRFGLGYVAYRADGVEVRPIGDMTALQGPFLIGRDREQVQGFLDLWHAGREPTPVPTAVYALRRTRGTPTLTLRLRPEPPRAGTPSLRVAWTVGRRHADMVATADLKGADAAPPLVEWTVPADVVVTRVVGRGDVVRHWSRSNGRLQVWLRPAGPDVALELFGWKELTDEGGRGRFDLPAVTLATPAAAPATIRVEPDGDLTLDAADVATLTRIEARPGERGPAYQPKGVAYGGIFRVEAARADFEARTLTTLSLQNRELLFSSVVEVRPRRGLPPVVALRLRGWDGEAGLAAAAPVRRAPKPGDVERVWLVEPTPGADGVARLTLAGRLAKPEEVGSRVAAPEVIVDGAAASETWLAVIGADLATDAGARLRSVPADGDEARRAWPTEAERLRGAALWKAEGDGATLRLSLRPRTESGVAVRVVLTEVTATPTDGGRWRHEAVCWLHHEANTDLHVELPGGARLRGAAVDDIAATPLPAPAGGLWVPLPGAAGARRVRLAWDFPEGESFGQPRLDRPRCRGAAEGPTVWTLHAPAEVVVAASGGASSASAANLDLARAQALFALSGLVADAGRAPPALVPLQQRLYRFLRFAAAAQALASGESFAAEALAELRDKNRELARARGFEELRAEAERQARTAPAAPPTADVPEVAGVGLSSSAAAPADPPPPRGTPYHWLGPAEAAAPRVALTSVAETRARRALGASALWGIVLLAVWILSRAPSVPVWARAFWPEELVLLGLLGWQTYGPSWPFAFLAVCGVAGRVLALARALFRRAPRAV